MKKWQVVVLVLGSLANGSIVFSATAFAGSDQICSGDWKITGYFVPVEADYTGPMQMVSVDGVGNVSFPVSFVNATDIEGWGLTIGGWYLGKPGAHWIKSPIAENARGSELKIGSLAVWNNIQLGSTFTILSAPSPWNTQILTADDHGSKIQKKHLDVFTGQGKAAERESVRITSNGYTAEVCYAPPKT